MYNKKLAIVIFLLAVLSLSVEIKEGQTCIMLTGMRGQRVVHIENHLGFVPYILQFKYLEDIFHTLLHTNKQYWQKYLKEFHSSELSEELLNKHNERIAERYLKIMQEIRVALSEILPKTLFWGVEVQKQIPGYIHLRFISSYSPLSNPLVLESRVLPWKEGQTYLKFTSQTAEQGFHIQNHLGFVPCMLQFESPMDMFHKFFNTDKSYWQKYLQQFHYSEILEESFDKIVEKYLEIIDQMHNILLEILPKSLLHGVVIKEQKPNYLHFRFDPGLVRMKLWENSVSGSVIGLGYFPAWGDGISRAEIGGENYVETYSCYRLNMLD